MFFNFLNKKETKSLNEIDKIIKFILKFMYYIVSVGNLYLYKRQETNSINL